MELNNIQKQFIDNKLDLLSRSKFRSGFSLKSREIEYISKNGFDVIEEHAFKFIFERLAKGFNVNDGRQTPMRGHPVFIGQHATATCCRGCLYKWHKIEKNKDLNEKEIRFIVALIMEWIKRNYK